MTEETSTPRNALTTNEVADATKVVPVIKERLDINSERVVTGEVEVQLKTESNRVEVPLTTVDTRYREVRIPVGKVIEAMPQPRTENGNLIVPVVREEEVVVKRLVLVEEIHLLREVETDERTETVDLREQTATVTRTPPKKI